MELFLCSHEAEWNYDVFSILFAFSGNKSTQKILYYLM